MAKTKTRRTTKNGIQKVVLYVRVSTLEQAEKDLSLPAQRGALEKYAADRGYQVVGVYEEAGASGRDDRNRKAFTRMMADVVADDSEADAILVYHSSRFFRNSMKARIAKKDLARRGVRVVSITQETSDDAMGEVIEKIFEVFDEYESEMNSARTLAAMRQNARMGYLNGSTAPFGFKAEPVEIRPGVTRRKLVPNPDEVPLHNEVFRLYLTRGGSKAVANELQARGLTYRDGAPWSKIHVYNILAETAAIGTYYWGREDSATGEENPREDWIAIPCEPIIDPDLFEAAKRVRASRDPRRVPGRTAASPLLLAGLVVCGKCHGNYTLETSGKLSIEGEFIYRYYNCNRFIRSGKDVCPGWRVAEKVLDKAVLEHVSEHVFTEGRCRAMLRDLVEEAGLLKSKVEAQRRELGRQLEEVEKKIARWTAAFEEGTLDPREGGGRVRELRAQRDQLTEALRLARAPGTPPAYLYQPEVLAKFRAALREAFLGADSPTTKTYLKFLLARVVVEDEVVHVEARPEAALQMLSTAASGESLVNRPETVLTNDLEWLRTYLASRA